MGIVKKILVAFCSILSFATCRIIQFRKLILEEKAD